MDELLYNRIYDLIQAHPFSLLIQLLYMISLNKLPLARDRNANTDLRLIGTYLRDEFEPHLHPRNLQELSSILKNKLQHSSNSREEKQKCREWLALRKVDIKPMLDLITEKRKQEERKEDGANHNLTNQQVVQPTLLLQEAYIQKIIDHSLNSMLQYAATNQSARRNVFQTLLRRLNCSARDSASFGQPSVPSSQSAVLRNQSKRRKYLEITRDLVERERMEGETFSMKQWSSTLAQNMDHNIWRILHHQVRNLNESQFRRFGPSDKEEERDALKQALLINSLLTLQSEFDEELPRNSDGISSYLERRYLSKIEDPSQYVLDPELGCVWGKAFLYFRAGRSKQLSNLLKKHGLDALCDQIESANKSIRSYRPKKCEKTEYHQKDVFRDQIIYALSGERKYTSNAISEPNSLDSIWILLRNTGVFYRTDKELFQETKQQMVAYYLHNWQHEPGEMVYFLAYLLEYDQLAQLGENQILDKDDYLHLLVLLSKYRFLVNDMQAIRVKLVDSLVTYALELSREEAATPYLEYYLSLIPKEVFLQEAPSIIVLNRLYTIIKWEALNKILGKEEFSELLKLSTELYVKQTDNYLEGAELLMSWLEKEQKISVGHISSAIDMLLLMLIKNSNSSRIYNGSDIKRAIKLFENWISGEPELQRNYTCLLELFENERRLTKYLIDRNFTQLVKFLENGESIFFITIDFMKGKMFEKLIELQGMDVFFTFLTNVVKAGDLIFTFEGSNGRSKDIRFEVLKMCKAIQQHQKFGKMSQNEALEELIGKLQTEIVNFAIS